MTKKVTNTHLICNIPNTQSILSQDPETRGPRRTIFRPPDTLRTPDQRDR